MISSDRLSEAVNTISIFKAYDNVNREEIAKKLIDRNVKASFDRLIKDSSDKIFIKVKKTI